VLGAVELVRFRRGLWPLALLIVLYEETVVLTLRAHWTMDVFTGAITALLVAIIASWLAPSVDGVVRAVSPKQGAIGGDLRVGVCVTAGNSVQ